MIVSLAWFVAFCVAAPPARAISPVKTMSFNIRYDNSSDGVNVWNSTTRVGRRYLAINAIAEVNPDILGVQEALRNQVNDLTNGLPQYAFYGVGRDNGALSGEHSGIYYRSDRFTRTGEGTFWLTATPDRPSSYPGACCNRIATWVILKDALAGGQEYFVLNTHWDHQIQAANDHSATLIRQRIDTLSAGRPLIVMGDLNSSEANSAYRRLVGADDPAGLQLTDSYRDLFPARSQQEATFHSFGGNARGSRIDFVFHDEWFKTLEASIVRTSYDGRYPSDHFPVTATLQLLIPEPAGISLMLVGVGLLAIRTRRR